MFRLTSRITIGFAAVAVPLALALGACTSATPDRAPPASQSQPQPSLDRFYDQDLKFGSCKGYATNANEAPFYVNPFECARLSVPLDYAKPEGETAQIGVLRLAARGEPSQRIGSLVINPGGPGGSGMQVAALASLGPLKNSEVLQRFDLVGFDPRGVGASTPAISCFTDEERDRGQDQTSLLGTSGEWSEDDTRSLMEKCAKGSGGEQVLGAVGTRNAARDIDVLRSALGEEKLTFAGQSYGTRLGAVYAEMFPQNVRAMVFDGVTDPRQGSVERRLAIQAGFQRAFDLMAASCAKSKDCPLGTDPEKATKSFQDLMRPLIDTPVPAGKGRTAGYVQATGAVVAGLYGEATWPTIIEGLTELKDKGSADTLLTLNDNFGGRDPNGVWSNMLEANLAVNCNDEERRTPEQEADLRRNQPNLRRFSTPDAGWTASPVTPVSSGPASPPSDSHMLRT